MQSSPTSVAFLALFVSISQSNVGRAGSVNQCRKETSQIVKQIDLQVKALLRSAPEGKGKQVNVGSCASRLRKLEGNFLCCKTFLNVATIWEEVSCLELKKFYVKKSCECLNQGGFTQDEIMQDGIFERYAAVQALRKKALEKLPNAAIREYVKDLHRTIDCMNNNSIKMLDDIQTRIEKAMELPY